MPFDRENAQAEVVTKVIASGANEELILKPNIFGTTIHSVVSIVRDNSEIVNLFPFTVTGEVSFNVIIHGVLALFSPVNVKF